MPEGRRKYNITAEAVGTMRRYTNVTPQVLDAICKNIDLLMRAFENEQKNIVRDHLPSYIDLLKECSGLIQVIASDMTDATNDFGSKAKTYEKILNTRIR